MAAQGPTPRFDAEAPSSAGFAQGMILVACAWLAVMATSLIAPVLPAMSAHFKDAPGGAMLVQMTVALPALMVALFAAPAGWLADRIGRRGLLIGALVVYALTGLAPTWLDDLNLILVSRCLVGVAEALVMTAGTALLGDCFSGAARERWFAIQTGSATLVSVVLLALSGLLGQAGWRTPFFAYALPLLLAVLVLSVIVEPQRRAARDEAVEGGHRGRLLAPILVTFAATIAFFVLVIQMPFLLTGRGLAAPALVGLGSALAAAALPVGAVLFRLLTARGPLTKLALSFGFYAAGFAIMTVRLDYVGTLLGAVVAGVGAGLALPTLLTWATASVPARERGRATGLWNTAFFLGQFLSPVLFLALAAKGGPQSALMIFAIGCGVALLVTLAALALRRPALSVADDVRP